MPTTVFKNAVEEVFGQTRNWFVGHREDDLPSVRPTPDVIGKWLFDEWALQLELANNRLRWPTVDFRRRLRSELGDGVEMFNERGWVDDPRSYHEDPPALTDPTLEEEGVGPFRYEHLSFDSGYEPHLDEPGRERWLGYEANATAHAWVLRHEGPPRPWLICINGYRTGSPLTESSGSTSRSPFNPSTGLGPLERRATV